MAKVVLNIFATGILEEKEEYNTILHQEFDRVTFYTPYINCKMADKKISELTHDNLFVQLRREHKTNKAEAEVDLKKFLNQLKSHDGATLKIEFF
jgi:hypothetical protein